MKERILFVDDDARVGKLFCKMAARMGYEVDYADCGVAAIDQVRRHHYPIIVTDLNMPGLDGLALLECLRGLSPKSVTLLVTGDPEVELPDAGAEDCSLAAILYKPLSYERLESALSRASELVAEQDTGGANLRQILLVENDPLDAQLTVARLRRDMPDVDVVVVGRIGDAENLYPETEFELVITDLVLPDARGVDAVSRLRHIYPGSAIVVLSGGSSEAVALQALKKGAQDYLLKDRVDGPSFKRAIRYAVERKTTERDLLRLAYYDVVTGLANRQLFQDRLVQALARVNRTKGDLSVVFIDLDRFKAVNDSLGHEAGDKLLKVIGRRLLRAVRHTDTVARLGGDEFAILFEGAPEHEVTRLSYRLIEAVCEPMELCGERVSVGASLGAAAYPKHGFTADGLLRAADSAMYKSKQGGRGRLSWAGEDCNLHALKRLRLESDLRQAVLREQFELHYQPQVSPRTGRTEGVEALIRWRKDNGKLVSPAEFLPLLGELGLMQDVGAWVIRSACAQAAHWKDLGWRVAVNLGVQQLTSDLPEIVDEAIKRSGIRPDRLELELTEHDIIKDSEQAASLLEKFRARGVRLALDDFGTGYSSLAYLQRFPVQSVKLDGAFLSDNYDQQVTKAVIELGHALNLSVVAEGVETREQYQRLSNQGCDLVQGYYLARPMGHEKLRSWNSGCDILAS